MEKPHVTCQWHGTGRAGKQQGEKPREVDISCHTNLQEVLKIQLCNSTFMKLTWEPMTKQCNDPSRAINKAVELFQVHVDTAADLNSEFLQCSCLLEWYLLQGQTLHQESLAKVFFGYFRDTESLYGLLLELETQSLNKPPAELRDKHMYHFSLLRHSTNLIQGFPAWCIHQQL